ncbi:TetR/AcrR family transcriptional regulator [Cryptosporangium phraense]|uniref:TetR/AcrR family transcriptional regulator n=1 Tax=Cryptosporangium phraense TaxID=2593070 RepID=A0A545AXG7_9ACTN|nr:TetR/AcrR family transcriptional regulator [Cryptosporangium phraense]TQS46022.1 TetR/AcrR family transcriptional regulator [Cryptosporangium phraense]
MKEGAYHHGNLRADLLAAAEKALETVGADGISLRGLARDLGVSHAAPSHHFRDKQALLDALAVEGITRLADATSAAASGAGTLRDRVDALVRAYVGFALAHEELLTLMLGSKHHPSASADLAAAADRGFRVAIALVEDGQANGDIRAGDPYTLAIVVSAQVHGVAAMLARGMLEPIGADVAIATTVELVTRGLSGDE